MKNMILLALSSSLAVGAGFQARAGTIDETCPGLAKSAGEQGIAEALGIYRRSIRQGESAAEARAEIGHIMDRSRMALSELDKSTCPEKGRIRAFWIAIQEALELGDAQLLDIGERRRDLQ